MKIVTHTVKPRIPEALRPLDEIAHNLWLSWNFDAIMLFIRLDYDTWLLSHQNPAKMLGMVSQETFDRMAADDSYLAALAETHERFTKYKEGHAWYQGPATPSIAYFSMEYGMDVSLPIYSGGLGILSGDHMKTASDLGLPLVGVGLLYRQGYFKQYLNADGFQQESYPENDWYNMPVLPCAGPDGGPVIVGVEMGEETVAARVWEAKVGRARLVLLDTNIEQNPPRLRDITATLYGGDKETRVRQEILLGIGGVRALRALGIDPAVTHMNEGHAAFLGLERVRELEETKGLSWAEALVAVKRTNIFTTHTPVPAGNERFATDLLDRYFRPWCGRLGISWEDFLALGKENPHDPGESFCMTVLALRFSDFANGVSELHGEVSREMWKGLWPGLPAREIPVGHVTNGVHPRTWISNNMLELLDRYFGPRFEEEPENLELWQRMARISDEELWRTHERRRERLVVFARDRLGAQLKAAGFGEKGVLSAADALSPYALTISFARRFATYKRGDLLLRDPDRLLKLLQDAERPIQLIFAGKAHPHDIPGKGLIRDIVHFTRRPEVRSRVIFLEDYDMTMARYMTSGSDLWLNTPRRPLEASGTSGMKAGMNGVLNCSVLDGWWAEAYRPEIGWAIGSGETYEDEELHDEVESKALYDLLEREIVPTFYARGRDGLPREWIAKMKASMATVGADFSCHRMLVEYSRKYYYPALEAAGRLQADGFAEAKALAGYLAKARKEWANVEVGDFSTDAPPVTERGDTVTVNARVKLGALTPEDVEVELYHGAVSSLGEIAVPERHAMTALGTTGDYWDYKVQVPCAQTGRQGYAVRVLPRHQALLQPFQSGLIRWA